MEMLTKPKPEPKNTDYRTSGRNRETGAVRESLRQRLSFNIQMRGALHLQEERSSGHWLCSLLTSAWHYGAWHCLMKINPLEGGSKSSEMMSKISTFLISCVKGPRTVAFRTAKEEQGGPIWALQSFNDWFLQRGGRGAEH